MRILIVGGTGTLGQAVHKALVQRHTIIVAGHNKGEIQVDITHPESIAKMYREVGKVDAVIATTGRVHFAPLTEMTAKHFAIGLDDKLMGQVNLVLLGLQAVNDAGSFTLTSGILSHDPIRFGTSAAMVNGAIESFVKSAAIELPRGIRINAVSPTVLVESLSKYAEYFPGFFPVSAEKAALAFCKSVEGAQTGQVYPAV